jgi:hypothetical protein
MIREPVPAGALERLVALLREAIDQPEQRSNTGQQAARLWWELEGAGHCGESTPEIWEEALLGLAAWHTGDDRLRFQRASEADIRRYLHSLG